MTEQKQIQPSKRYSTFYLVMLIISTIGAASSTLGALVSIPRIAADFSISPAHFTFAIITSLALIVTDIALVFLWQKKNPLGLRLITISYAVSVVSAIGEALFVQPVLQKSLLEIDAKLSAQDLETTKSLASLFTYSGYVLGILTFVAFIILWQYAYKNQNKQPQARSAVTKV